MKPFPIHGAGGKKKGPSEAKNSLVSKQLARFVDVISEGPIRGLANASKSIILSGVPHQNDNGTYNHTGFNWEERKGEATQSPSTLLSAIESEHPVNIEVSKKSGPVVQAVTEDNLDGFRVRIRIPSLMHVKDNGDIVASSVRFSIEWSLANSGVWNHINNSPMTLNGKNNSPYYVDYEFFPPVAGPWQIRVTRISPDDESAKNASATFFDAWVGIISQKVSMPYTAYVAFDVDAEQFGSTIPERTYDVYGRIVRVPSNFNGDTREYTGFWDGSWKLAWTNDPAWCFLDLATDRRYGGAFPDNEINIAALYEISKYSSEKVPDGKGGTEFRYSLDVCINTREDAYNLFKKMITTFRGMMFWAGGQISVAQDCPKPVKYVAAPANTENGTFIYRSTSDESRANTIHVTYNNPDDGDKPDIEVAEKPDDIIRRGTRIAEVQAWGCRSQGQARRLGEWMLYTLHYDTEIVSYVAGADHDAIYPGDVIAVHDPAKTATKKASGRIMKQVSLTSFLLDRDLPTDIAIGFQFSVMDNNKVVRYAKITNISTDRKTITVDLQISAIDPENMWIIYESNTRLREYVVTSIKPNGIRRSVTALAYNRSKFDFVERGITLETPPRDPINTGNQLKEPRWFDYSIYRVANAGTANIVRLLVSWTAPDDEPRIAFYRLQLAIDELGEPTWETVYEGRDSSYTIDGLDPTSPVAIRIQSVGLVGNQVSSWQTISNIELSSRAVPPTAPEMLTVTPELTGRALTVSWVYENQPTDFITVEVYRSTTNNFANAVKIGQSADGSFRDNNLNGDAFYFYWVRAVVMTDNPSARYSPFRGPVSAVALSVPAGNVLDNSVTASKIADGAVWAAKLAQGAVTHEKLAANSIYGDKIAAGAITAREMVLTDHTNVIPDAALEGGNWNLSTGLSTAIVTSADFSLGGKAFSYTNPTSGTWTILASGRVMFPTEAGQSYLLRFETKGTAAREVWARFRYYDANKAPIAGAAGYSATVRGKSTGSANVEKHTGVLTVPANAAFAVLEIYASFPSASAGTVLVGGLYAQRRNAAELIVDGSLIAGMIAANSINANHLMAKAVTADKMNVVQISAISGDFGRMRAGVIASDDDKFIIDLNNRFISIEV